MQLERRCPRDYLANRLRGQLLAPVEFDGAEVVPPEQRARALLRAVLAAPAETRSEPLGRHRFIFPSTVEEFRKRDKRVLVHNISTGEQKWTTKEKAETLDRKVWTSKREPDGKRYLHTRRTAREFRAEIDKRYGKRSWLPDNDAQPTVLSPDHLVDYMENVAEPEHQETVNLMAAFRDPDTQIMKGEPLYGPPPTPEIPSVRRSAPLRGAAVRS